MFSSLIIFVLLWWSYTSAPFSLREFFALSTGSSAAGPALPPVYFIPFPITFISLSLYSEFRETFHACPPCVHSGVFEEPGLFFVTYNMNLNVAFNFLPGHSPVSHLAPFVCICLWKVPLFVSPFNFLPLSQPFFLFIDFCSRFIGFTITHALLRMSHNFCCPATYPGNNHLLRSHLGFEDLVLVFNFFFQNQEKTLLFSFLPLYILNAFLKKIEEHI